LIGLRWNIGQIYAQFKFTALFLAAENGQADCVRLLLDAGAKKEAEDKVRRVDPTRLQ
jgi:hypothetical protein